MLQMIFPSLFCHVKIIIFYVCYVLSISFVVLILLLCLEVLFFLQVNRNINLYRSLIFSSSVFVASCFTFKSLIHLELIWGMI